MVFDEGKKRIAAYEAAGVQELILGFPDVKTNLDEIRRFAREFLKQKNRAPIAHNTKDDTQWSHGHSEKEAVKRVGGERKMM